jgi:ATP-dependent Clp protease protease subunit
MEQMIADNTGQPVDKVSRDVERDKYLTAQEAVEYGIIDDILPSLKDLDSMSRPAKN